MPPARRPSRALAHGFRTLYALATTTLILGALTMGCGATADRAAVTKAGTTPVTISARAEAGAAPAFPLAIAPGKRYLVDAAGRPFLLQGDAAWSLIADLTREEVELYLDDRRARGFNTILVNLIEHRFSKDAPANAYGEAPFRTLEKSKSGGAGRFPDFASPNEAYFAHADWVLRRAAEEGFLVLLTPAYAGWEGGSQGWYRAMVANGPDRLRQYGAYLGRRYRDFTNILWVQAGDYDPPDKDLVRAIVTGIREFDPRALQTAHGTPDTPLMDYWQGEPWLQVNNVYTYDPVYISALEEYRRPAGMPFFLIESAYENEHEASEQRLRTQAYQAVLSGAAGQVFGNNPIWHFDGPGIYDAPASWQEELNSRGAQSMTHLHDLLASLPWWLLEPDLDHRLLTGGRGSEDERAVAARTADGSLAIIYMPDSREITVDLARLAGPEVTARWYDPANGQSTELNGSPFSAAGARSFKPRPRRNSSGFDDWLLILESTS